MSKPKVLVYDIETSPNLAYVWGKYEQNVLSYEKERELLSFAYAWVGENRVRCETRRGEKDDKRLVGRIATLLQEADITVAHNGDNFDRKIIKSRMIYWDMKPLKVNCSVDTFKVAKNYFQFNGNSLSDLSKFLKLGQKTKSMGFDMWLGCMKNDPKAWATMATYNKMDVELLLKLYKRFLPYIENHPNISKLIGEPGNGCPGCGASSGQRKYGLRPTSQGVQQRWYCLGCSRHYLTRRVK